MKECWVGNQ